MFCYQVFIDSEFGEEKNNAGPRNNCTHQDGHGYHITLVLPIDKLTGRTTTAKKGVGIHFLTMSARSCDRSEHLLILAFLRLSAIDPNQ